MPSPIAAPRRPGFRHFLQRRFAWSVTSLLVLLILLSGLLVALPLARRHAQNLFMAQAEAVQARLEAAFGPVEPVLQLLVTAWASDAPSLQTSLPFVQAARGALQALPLATSAVVGNARGEGWMLLQHPQRPEWWLRLTDRARWGEEQRFMAWDAHGVELRRWSERLPYDPRERPWYRLGQGHPARMVWTPPTSSTRPAIWASPWHAAGATARGRTGWPAWTCGSTKSARCCASCLGLCDCGWR